MVPPAHARTHANAHTQANARAHANVHTVRGRAHTHAQTLTGVGAAGRSGSSENVIGADHAEAPMRFRARTRKAYLPPIAGRFGPVWLDHANAPRLKAMRRRGAHGVRYSSSGDLHDVSLPSCGTGEYSEYSAAPPPPADVRAISTSYRSTRAPFSAPASHCNRAQASEAEADGRTGRGAAGAVGGEVCKAGCDHADDPTMFCHRSATARDRRWAGWDERCMRCGWNGRSRRNGHSATACANARMHAGAMDGRGN
jgi:hypothetical protein